MAEVWRGPVVVNRRDLAPALQVFAQQGRNLAIGLAAALPIGAASLPQAQQHTGHLRLSVETSAGTPLVLLAAVEQAPFVVAPHSAPAHRPQWLADTSGGTPKGLVEDGQAPTGAAQTASVPPHRAVAERLVVDTSAGTPKGLVEDATQPVGAQRHEQTIPLPRLLPDATAGTPKTLTEDAQRPTGAQQDRSIPWHHGVGEWLPADASRGSAKTLLADAQSPVGAQQSASIPAQHGRCEWLPADTSAGVPFAAIAPVVVALPPGVQWLASAAQRYSWLNADTTVGAAKTLREDAQLPVGLARTESVAPVPSARAWLPGSTAAGSAKPLIEDASLPVGQASAERASVQRPAHEWLPASTAASSPTGLVAPPPAELPPGAQLYRSAPQLFGWLNADGSRGTPKGLTLDATAPVGVAWSASIPVQRTPAQWLPLDTSATAWGAQHPTTFVDGNGRVWHIDARGRVVHIDARAQVWHVR